MYLGQVVSDFKKLGLKSKLESYSLKSKQDLIIEQKPSVLWSIKRFYFLGHPVFAVAFQLIFCSYFFIVAYYSRQNSES